MDPEIRMKFEKLLLKKSGDKDFKVHESSRKVETEIPLYPV